MSGVTTYYVSKAARELVTVALSGDGGDELFCGYNRYFHALSIRPYVSAVPLWLRRAVSTAIRAVPPRTWDRIQPFVPRSMRRPQLGDKLHKLATVMLQDEDQTYLRLLSQFHEPEAIVLGGTEPPTPIGSPHARELIPDYVERMQYLDTLTYLPDDILTKVDRASMAVSLEARVPIIDHRVVELAWRFPRRMRFRDGKSKWILRRVLRRFVPDKLIERPKMGFGVPIDHWLRGSLRDWAEELLSPSALAANGFSPALIRSRWAAHVEERENWQYLLWTIITAQAWLADYARTPAAPVIRAEPAYSQ